MKKKICMVVPSFSAKGGITSVVSGYRGSQLEKDFEIKYIETYCDGKWLSKLLIALKAYISYIWLLLFWHPTIVHIHSSFGGSFYRKMPFIIIGRWFKKPIVNHIHGSYYNEFYFETSKKKQAIISNIYNRCAAIIALSETAKVQLSRITNSPITVIENYGVLKEDEIKKRKLKSNNNIVLFLGFITEKKGCFDIPHVIKKVVEKIPDVKFVLAGVGEIEKVKKIMPLNEEENIVFPGWITGEEKSKLLSEADVFFLPSYSEGMPMSILDAMGYGLPIVASNVGGIPNLVLNEENGFIFQPGDINGFADSIILVLRNDDLRNKMIDCSAQIIREKYSQNIHIEKIKNIYKLL